jgi:hypothetical protein
VTDLFLRLVWSSPPLTAVLRWLVGGGVPHGIYCHGCPFATFDRTKLGWDGRPGSCGCAILPRQVHEDSPVLWDGVKECGMNDGEGMEIDAYR